LKMATNTSVILTLLHPEELFLCRLLQIGSTRAWR